jgi:hypothetical protein
MNKYRIYRDRKHSIYDVSPIELVSNIIRLASARLKLAATKAEVFALEKIIVNVKKILIELRNKASNSKKIKVYIKDCLNLLKSNIGSAVGKFIKWVVIMLEKANEQNEQSQLRERAESAAAAAKEAAALAAEKYAKWSETKKGKKVLAQVAKLRKLKAKDSNELIKLYRDSLSILNTLKCLKCMLVAHKYTDDRRRISTTKTPTMWEKKYVLGIKPGVSFNERDWKAYKENGFIVVENKRTGQTYRKPQTEVIAAANAERQEKLNTADPYLNSGNIQYGTDVNNPKNKKSLISIMKTIAATIASVTMVVNEIKSLHSGSSGLGGILLNFANGAVNWLRNAKEAWKQVNKAV